MKILPHIYHIYENYFQEFPDSNYPNRRNRMKLKLPRVRTEQGKNMTKYQGACIWNEIISQLPSHFEVGKVSLKACCYTIKNCLL